MILRSPLRMNKNIVFPFISCIMIMLTLLVLIHKSADELSAAKKEISLCKQQHDTLYNQLQSAIEFKLRLEKSLQNEKADNKQKVEDIQAVLGQEKEDRRKEKQEGENRYDALNQKFLINESELDRYKKSVQNLNDEVAEKNNQISTLEQKLSSLGAEKDKLLAQKNKEIEDLQAKVDKRNQDDLGPASSKKITPETIENGPGLQQPEGVQLPNPNATTPKINPDAVLAAEEEPGQKLVGPPPPPPPQEEQAENSLQKQMRKELNAPLNSDVKPQENVKKPEDNVENPSANEINGKNNQEMVLPLPNMGQEVKKPQPSVASNAVGDQPQADPHKVLPIPINEKVIPKQMKEYNGDYDKDNLGDEEGEGEYMDNDIGKGQVYPKKDFQLEKHFEESINDGESVVLHPK